MFCLCTGVRLSVVASERMVTKIARNYPKHRQAGALARVLPKTSTLPVLPELGMQSSVVLQNFHALGDIYREFYDKYRLPIYATYQQLSIWRSDLLGEPRKDSITQNIASSARQNYWGISGSTTPYTKMISATTTLIIYSGE